MTVRMTKKLQHSLGIKELPSSENKEKPHFIDEWYMNIFNIRNNWFFIFMESTTFYTIVKPAQAINGSKAFIEYFQELIIEIFNRENERYLVKSFFINDMHLRNTENKAERRIIVDMVYHAENMKYKKGQMKVFQELNEIPQALLQYKNPREAFRYQLGEMIKNRSDEISFN